MVDRRTASQSIDAAKSAHRSMQHSGIVRRPVVMTAKIRACILATSFATSCRAGEAADETGISSSTAADASDTSGASSEAEAEGSEGSSAPGESSGSSASTDVSSTSGDPPACEGIEPPTDGFHVTVDGTPEGDGSIDAPWDLATALAHPAAVTPGSTIWVHGGAYPGPFTSTLTGTTEAPIVVRAMPGERATLDGTGIAGGAPDWMRLEGAHTWLWGFEITTTHTDPGFTVATAFSIAGTGIKLVNLVVHDVFNNGFFQSAVDLEIYGTLFYNVGHNASGGGDDSYGYPMYVQNLEGNKLIEDNVVMNNFSFGLHAYTEGGYLEQISLVGNVWFNNGVASPGEGKRDDILLGPVNNPARAIEVRDNAVWAHASDVRAVRFGYGAPNEDIELVGNYFVGQTLFSDPWSSITMTDNTFFSAPTGEIDPAAHPRNTYLDAPPAQNEIRVRANRYEPGRAHVIVYNWEDADTVAVDLEAALEPGTAFEIRNAQTFWEPPVASGVFDGNAIDLPMAEVTPTPSHVAPDDILPSERTGRAFHVFVVVPTACP
jgi:hypothetical protein